MLQMLQMATIGSKTSPKRGVWLTIQGTHITDKSYFNIANIDNYNIILGTPFMEQHSMIMGFGKNRHLTFGNGQSLKPLLVQTMVMKGRKLIKPLATSSAADTIETINGDMDIDGQIDTVATVSA